MQALCRYSISARPRTFWLAWLATILMATTGCETPFADPSPAVVDTRCLNDGMIGWSDGDTQWTKDAITAHDFAWNCACAPEPMAECPKQGGSGSL